MPYRKTLRALLLGFVGALQCLFLVTTTWGQTQASVPHLVKYNGVLRDGAGKPMVGTVGVSFALYKEEQGGSPLWVESQNVQLDALGRYAVELGATKSEGLPQDLFVSGEARWLGVRAEGQAEQPRSLLLSVPYALKAGDAETVGGLPASAFLLAGANGSSSSSSANGASGNGSSQPSIGGSGTQNFIPLWTDNNGDLGNSVLFQSGTGSSAKTGVNTTTPAATLDVNGGEIVRGAMQLPATGTATAAKGFTSQPLQLQGSSFNSTTQQAIGPVFQLQTEPASNNTASPSGTLNLLYSNGSGSPTETGLNIASNGQIKFASGQTFPGAGTITGITAGTGLSGGGTSGNVTLSINIPFANQNFANLNNANTFTKSQTVNGNLTAQQFISTALQGTAPLQVTSTTQVPNLNASFLGGLSASAFQPAGSYATLGSNSFNGNQNVTGNVTASGAVSTGSYQLGGLSWGVGDNNNQDVFLGFATPTTPAQRNTGIGANAFGQAALGNDNTAVGANALLGSSGNANTALGSGTMGGGFSTGTNNTAVGVKALTANMDGSYNTVEGYLALAQNYHGSHDTAIGSNALPFNVGGSYNTAVGDSAFSAGSGNYVTCLGYNCNVDTDHTNSTAIGANAKVTQDNSLVLGSINGINGATADTLVGIGTTAPAAKLDVHGTANFTGLVSFAPNQTFPGAGTITGVTAGTGLSGGGTSGNVPISLNTSYTDGRYPQLVANNTFTGTNNIFNNNVGVGISNPFYQMHVMGGIRTETGPLSAGSGAEVDIDAPFKTGGRMTILANGNVGINTHSPASILDVNGNIHTATLSIGQDVTMTSAPRMHFSGFLPGNVGQDQIGSFMVATSPILLTRMTMHHDGNSSQCSDPGVIAIEDGTQVIQFINLRVNSSSNFTDSGPINQAVGPGTALIIKVNEAPVCNPFGSVANIMVNVEYVMN